MSKWIYLFVFFYGICQSLAFADPKTINLVVSYKTVHFAGKDVKAIAFNNQIPGPTLHFKEGDRVKINVYNHLNEETAVHWHGLLVPWQMDGVLGITQHGIPPGGVFHYQFTVYQSGTYWYHAHAGLQEQQGLYGAFIIDPKKKPNYHYTKDYLVVLSDWSNTQPEQILANLKKEGDYYSPRFPLQPSLSKFIHDYRNGAPAKRRQLLDDYLSMQQMRMSIYDFSDVAYNAFLLNGQSNSTPWTGLVKKGDIVRLRFIGAAGSTIFHIKIPGSTMQVVHVQGNDVKPYKVHDLMLAPGETYDVLVRIETNDPDIIYAESIDTVGAALGALITEPNQRVNYQQVSPFHEPLPITETMMMNMMHGMKMDHSMNMPMPTEPSIIGDKISPPNNVHASMKMPAGMSMDHMMGESSEDLTFGTKYQDLKAAVKTNDPNKPIEGTIKMELFGYMDRFIWFINGVPEYNLPPIVLKPGKRYRIIFTNPSMMRHPMHIHGHWFILRNGHNAYDPLLHTLDIPPGATVTADLDTDASGQWFFHCHLIYHMMTGMSRVFQYSTLIELKKDEIKPEDSIKQTAYHNRPIVRVDEVRPIDWHLVKHPMAHPAGLWLATFLDVGEDPFKNIQQISYKGLYGADYNKLELLTEEAEIKHGKVENADIDIFYWHLLDQFWAMKGGANYFYRPAQKPYWQPGIGLEGVMPYFIDTNARGYYYSGSAKADVELSRDTQITNNFFIRVGIRSIVASKTVNQGEIGNGLNEMFYTVRPYYRLMPGLNLFTEFEHEQYYGAFRNFQRSTDEGSSQNTLTFGLSVLF